MTVLTVLTVPKLLTVVPPLFSRIISQHLQVFANIHNISDPETWRHGLPIDQVHIHPYWIDRQDGSFDVAIVSTTKDVPSEAGFVCLPCLTNSTKPFQPVADETCITVGWGKDQCTCDNGLLAL